MGSELPPLNPLRAFVCAGRLLNIRKAASELNVTPGAVSRQVKVLEAHLGLKLFRRSANSLTLTSVGERYLEDVTLHMDAIADATRKITGRVEKDVLRIRAYTTFAMRWLIPRLNGFHASHPSVEVQLTTSLEAIDFEREHVDGAIRLGDGEFPGLVADKLVDNELVPVCSPGLAASAGLKEPADLARVPLLHSLARLEDWRLWAQSAGLDPALGQGGPKFQSSVLSYEAAALGQGVAIAQKVLVLRELANGTLVVPFGPACDRGRFTYYLVFPRRRLQKPAFRDFRHWLLAEAQKLPV